ncbi:RNA-binding S4 domain-containing protein [Tissierella praeacuta]|uniref:RQC P-site tRNA stabilizing factor n=1 Tax=Tissierella praeacuta DSM 18095 TaxID=1123404 RepID=A0A1M4UNW6_9FIRM|nr:RNA-binding S4 domain-containing protein [Tissierella praeacuta]MBU5257282.1 RNA-binding S4 domain-containing protein [Tissierella praeacuta]TCU68895.1 ribosomal 50S subunit-recycling heat shock protein [Tissierella praeacuta]SHE58283.1 Ribosomal 50S subunit-recycling heat shock protein, contains S4 domain [Tissierella praeacuta DSM 18095]SUP03500.1 ribosome-associated heat shock protein Hsp15 [Tissierella praeacuta]
MRIDKYLKNARIIKRRTIAKEACEQGRVFINEKQAKPGDEVKIDDTIKINFGNESMKIQVLGIADNVKKDNAIELYKKIE